ncbi:MAG: nodulation protein NfeD [Methylococcaceae bacterium]|nr:nodulation protein NfeD [Methylococcaceae bacterium]
MACSQLAHAGVDEPGSAPVPAPVPVIQIPLNGPIGPASADFVARSLDHAARIGSPLIILRMDTPGGLDGAMRDIIKRILASPIPVVTYVAPSGARAASAGTYILYASHIAAMAPATNLGAATPIQIPMSGGMGDEDTQPRGKSEDKNPDQRAVMERKAINDAVAYIRGLAALRGRNADWADQAVRESVSLPAEEALKRNVIDLLATDSTELLSKLDGRSVNIQGQSFRLNLSRARVEVLEADWRNQLLAAIANPNVAYILLMLGIYGLMMEFYHPGAVVPGTLGTICLLLALYAFQALSINFTGIALVFLGLGLMVAEAFVPSFGILGIGGMTAFVFGSILFMDSGSEGIVIHPAVITSFTIASVALCIIFTRWLIRVRRKPVVSGREQLIGGLASALEDFSTEGRVRIHSETWMARTDQAVKKNQRVVVTGIEGLTLIVTPFQSKAGD